MTLTVRSAPLDDARPLLDLVPDGAESPLAWVAGDEGLVAWGVAARIEPGAGRQRFVGAHEVLRALAADAQVDDPVARAGSGLVAFGSFAFADDGASSVLVVPRVVVGRRDGATWLTTVDAEDATPAPPPRSGTPVADPPVDRARYAGSSKPDLHWLQAVADAVARIEQGTLDKVVLARDHAVWSREPFDALAIARRLWRRFPSCHTFVVEGLVGATPELLLARHGDEVTSRVLAGTAARGGDPRHDDELGGTLLASAKERHEHALAVASVEPVLRGHCDEVTHDPEPQLLRLDNVQHLATTFTGRLATPATSLELASALHPTAAVGGTPRSAALATIRELEGMDRGRYAAPVGWTDADGDGEWGIALRCAELSGARARLFAGAGIVAGSLPEAELAETRLKLLAMQQALHADP